MAVKQPPGVRLPGSKWIRKRRKLFVVGLNKTGTTSMAVALRELGWKVGRQEEAELMVEDWMTGKQQPVIDHCRTADAGARLCRFLGVRERFTEMPHLNTSR